LLGELLLQKHWYSRANLDSVVRDAMRTPSLSTLCAKEIASATLRMLDHAQFYGRLPSAALQLAWTPIDDVLGEFGLRFKSSLEVRETSVLSKNQFGAGYQCASKFKLVHQAKGSLEWTALVHVTPVTETTLYLSLLASRTLRQGYGKAAVVAVKKLAKWRGMKKVSLHSAQTCHHRCFYEHMGLTLKAQMPDMYGSGEHAWEWECLVV
jgi:hypothetical protein